MPTTNYAANELREQLARGPHAGEDFFRLNVSGNGRSNWVNITPEQLAGIVAVLETDDPAMSRKVLVGALEALVRSRGNTPATRELVLYELDQATKEVIA